MKQIIVAGLVASALLGGATEAEAHYNTVTWKPGAEVHMGVTDCASVQFVPQSDYTGWDIAAWNLDIRKGGFSCRVARRVVRKVVLGRSGVGHWHCRYRVHNSGLTHSDYRCRSGHRLVVWLQS